MRSPDSRNNINTDILVVIVTPRVGAPQQEFHWQPTTELAFGRSSPNIASPESKGSKPPPFPNRSSTAASSYPGAATVLSVLRTTAHNPQWACCSGFVYELHVQGLLWAKWGCLLLHNGGQHLVLTSTKTPAIPLASIAQYSGAPINLVPDRFRTPAWFCSHSWRWHIAAQNVCSRYDLNTPPLYDSDSLCRLRRSYGIYPILKWRWMGIVIQRKSLEETRNNKKFMGVGNVPSATPVKGRIRPLSEQLLGSDPQRWRRLVSVCFRAHPYFRLIFH